jgi:hypothetical protein
MTRITSKQKEIFDRHLEAFKNGWEDSEGREFAKVSTLADLREALEEEKIVKDFFIYCWERSVSIPSQLIQNMWDEITGKAVQDCRTFFKSRLDQLEVS